MTPIVLRKNKEGKMTTLPSRLMVKHVAKGVEEVDQDLRGEVKLTFEARVELKELKKKVSPSLLKLLRMQLEPFCEFMQVEMAQNLAIFAQGHLAYTTGCVSADTILDICYTWIAEEHGILNKDFIQLKEEMSNG
jgi:hypothetical protein